MDLIVIGSWKLKRQMNNIMQHFDFYKSSLDQISEEIKILQKEIIPCKGKSVSDFHNTNFDKITEEIKTLQNT